MKLKFKEKLCAIGAALAGVALLAGSLSGCASLNTNAFNAEKLLADSAKAATHSFNVYYPTATNGASAEKISELNATRDQIYDADRKAAAVLAVVEAARLAYSTNQTPANQAALQAALSSLSANSGNVTGLVSNAMAPWPAVPKGN